MEFKLIKLKEGYIIVSDKEIKEADIHINLLTKEIERASKNLSKNFIGNSNFNFSVRKQYKKIIASNFIPELPNIDFNNLEEEFGIINVEKLALENAKLPVNNHKQQDLNTEIWISGARQLGFKEGFNKCLELNKNKLYTEEDMKNCWKSAKTHQDSIRSKEYQINPKKSYSEFIQSLQPKTEFEVEVEHTCNGIKREGESCNKNNNCTYPNCGEIKINKI